MDIETAQIGDRNRLYTLFVIFVIIAKIALISKYSHPCGRIAALTTSATEGQSSCR